MEAIELRKQKTVVDRLSNQIKTSEGMKPNTVDLMHHARLNINHLTRNVDTKLNGLPYFWAILEDPVRAEHFVFDYGDITSRYVDALILTRLMTGDKTSVQMEKKLKKRLLSLFSEPDGLCYREESPWSKHDAIIFDQSRALTALVTWYMQTHSPKVKKYIDGLVHGLSEIAVSKDGYVTLPYRAYPPTGWDPDYDGGVAAKGKSNPAYEEGPLIRPLVKCYEEMGNKQAFELAEKLIARILQHSDEFASDGSFRGHFHVHAATVAGILSYGLVTEREDLVEWARKVYQFMKSQGSSFGWFPELAGVEVAGCESCILSDMIDIAIMLAKNGYEEYWNDVEKFARNHLVESQLSEVSWIKPAAETEDTPQTTYKEVPERIRGGFAGWSAPSDFIGPSRKGEPVFKLMNCCSAAGGHALYLVWKNIVTKKPEGVFVNLSLNRDTKWVEVSSYHPHVGKVEVRIHNAPITHIRIPDWVDREKVNVLVDGTPRELEWKGSYVTVQGLHTGDKLVVTYPLRHTMITEKIKGFKNQEFAVTWRGDTVVDIKPSGHYYPLYQRSNLDNDSVPMKRIKFHSSVREIQW